VSPLVGAGSTAGGGAVLLRGSRRGGCRGSVGDGQGLDAGVGVGDGTAPGPVVGEFEDAAAPSAHQAGGDVEDPQADGVGFGAGFLAV
jgi:hypothetical protein